MQHDAWINPKKQKRTEEEAGDFVWIFMEKVTRDAEPSFHMVEINKQTHVEIYEDSLRFEQEDVEIRMDFNRDRSPFTKLTREITRHKNTMPLQRSFTGGLSSVMSAQTGTD